MRAPPVFLSLLAWGLNLLAPPRAPAQTTWVDHSPAGQTEQVWSAVYGAGTFVAVGNGGVILTSPDGLVWTRRTANITDWLVSVTYGNGLFIAVGDNGRIITSPDAISWSFASAVTTSRLNGVVYANGVYAAVGENGTIVSSTDGLRWTRRDSRDVTTWLHGIIHVNGAFVATGEKARFLRSIDGVTWSAFTLPGVSFDCENLVAAQGIIVVVTSGGRGEIWTAPDFNGPWIRRAVNPAGFLEGITYGPNGFVATGVAGTILTSTDGIAWSAQASGTTRNLYGAAFALNRYLALGELGTIFASNIPPSTFANMSTRGVVGSGANAMIAGANIRGIVAKRVLVRAVGPTLASLFGVPGTVSRPVLTVFDAQSAQLFTNSGWTTNPISSATEIAAAAAAAGAFPLQSNSNDAAMIVTLAPGSYTFQVASADNSSGVALVELYELP